MKKLILSVFSIVLLFSVACFANSPPDDYQINADGIDQVDDFNIIISVDVVVASDLNLDYTYEYNLIFKEDQNYSVEKNVENFVENSINPIPGISEFSTFNNTWLNHAMIFNLCSLERTDELEVHLICYDKKFRHNNNLKTYKNPSKKCGISYFDFELEHG